MPDETNLHWTENEDLLAQYILKRLSEEERRNCEEHLLSCSQCREVVRQERGLISGIRHYGRDQLKSRLTSRLSVRSESKRSFMTWQRTLSAAAVVIIIAGIGIYNRWFTWKEQKPPMMTEELNLQPEGASESGAGAGQSKDKGALVREDRQKTSRDEGLAYESRAEQTVEPTFGISEPQPDQTSGMKKLEHAVSAPAAGGAVSAEREPGNEQNVAMTAQTGVTGFWVEGKIFGESDHINARIESHAKELTGNVPKSKPSAEQRSQQPTQAHLLERDAFRISQRSVGLLPPVRQQLQKASGRFVQAFVQQTELGVNLTVYPSTLFSEQELQSARVEEVAPDSIIVFTNEQRMGFRMPPGFLESQSSLRKTLRK